MVQGASGRVAVANLDIILKRFEGPNEVTTFENGKFEVIRIGGMTIGRATYEPGWKWSLHVGPRVGASRCNVEHIGLVLSGCATAAMENGTIHELRAGTLFYIPSRASGPRQLGCWQRAVRVVTFYGRGRVREEVANCRNAR